MNPMSKMVQSNTPIGQLMGVLQGGANPYQLAQDILNKNPKAQQVLNSAQNQCGNRSARDGALEFCRNNGADMNLVMQVANFLGLR